MLLFPDTPSPLSALLRDILYWQNYAAVRASAGRNLLFKYLDGGKPYDRGRALSYQRLSAIASAGARENLFIYLILQKVSS